MRTEPIRLTRLRGPGPSVRLGPWLYDLLALIVLALATVGFFWRVLLAGEWMPAGGGDLASFLYPNYNFAARAIHSGTLPFWNPYLYGGMPFAADIQNALFYPVNLIVWLMAPQITYRGMMGLAIFHVWLAGAAAYLCWRGTLQTEAGDSSRLRTLLPPLAGALAYMFSDFFIIHFGNLNLIAQAAWFPLIFLFFHRALTQPRLAPAVGAGVCFGVAATAGHMQPLLFIALVLALYAIYRLVADWRARSRGLSSRLSQSTAPSLSAPHPPAPSPSAPHPPAPSPLRGEGGRGAVGWLLPLAVLGLTLAIGLGLAAVALLPAIELAAYSPRATYDYTQASQYSLPPAQLIGLLVPSFFGRDPAQHWGLWDRVEVGYAGVLTLLLALLALLARRDRTTRPLAVLATFSLLAALGGYTVLHGWLYQLVPGLGGMRAPARFIFVFDFALAGLAAAGLATLMARERAERALSLILRAAPWVVGALALVALPLAYHAVLTSQDKDATIFARASAAANGLAFFVGLLIVGLLLLHAVQRQWLRPVAAGALAAGLIFFDLASLGSNVDVGAHDPTRTFDHPAIIDYLKSDQSLYRIDTRTNIWHLWQPDTPLLHGIYDVWGVVNPLVLADYDRFLNGLPDRTTRLYDFLNVKYVIAAKDVTLDWQKFAPVFDDDPSLAVYLNRAALPRALVVHRALSAADHEAAWKAVMTPGFDPAREVVVEGDVSVDATPRAPAIIQFDRHTPNELQLRVATSAEGYLVLSEVWYPGWRAWVDGAPAPVLRANYAFRAVYLPPGEHVVRMTYAPSRWPVGLAISATTLIAVLVALILPTRSGLSTPKPER
jgi:hypothetical protein